MLSTRATKIVGVGSRISTGERPRWAPHSVAGGSVDFPGRPVTVETRLVVVAEGASPATGQAVTAPTAAGPMDKLLGAGHKLAAMLEPQLELDVRVTVLGHLQRGGSPTQYDRILGTGFGTAAVDCVAAGRFGSMVALRTPEIVTVPLTEALANPRRVDPGGQMVTSARDIGLVFGDEAPNLNETLAPEKPS